MRLLVAFLLVNLPPAVLAEEPATPLQSVAAIDTMMAQGWYEEAGDLLERHVQADNPDPEALYLKAKVDLYFGRLDEAENSLDRLLDADPERPEYWLMRGTVKAARIETSSIFSRVGLAGACRKDFEKTVELEPENVAALKALVQFYIRAPGIIGGDKDEARRITAEILAIDPAEGHLARSLVRRLVDKDPDQALQEMAAAIEARPGDPALCYNLADEFLGEGRLADAEHYYRLGRERDPDKAGGTLRLASFCMRTGKLEDALDLYQGILRDFPDYPQARVGVALVRLVQDRTLEGENLLREVIRDQPEYLPSRYYLAQAHIRAGKNYREAADMLSAYLAGYLNVRWPSRSMANWLLALALEKLGEYDEAWEKLQLAMEQSRGGNDHMKQDAKRLEFMARND